jgi:hypothetical protein
MNGEGALAMGFRFLITALRTVLFISHPDGVINIRSLTVFFDMGGFYLFVYVSRPYRDASVCLR